MLSVSVSPQPPQSQTLPTTSRPRDEPVQKTEDILNTMFPPRYSFRSICSPYY